MEKPPFKMIVETEMEKYRCDTFWTKEPETIEWIKSFKDGDIFCDIGANIGIYTLYAASLLPGMLIYAIEPDRRNYARLLQNIALNRFKNILCFNMALSRYSCMRRFYVPKIEIGSSGGQIGSAEDENGRDFNPKESYFSLVIGFCVLIDYFDLDIPTHIKIDVDGQEDDVLAGFFFFKKRTSSFLIEFNQKPDIYAKILADFEKNGFTTDNRFNKLENHSRIRRAREGIKAENVIFTRER